MQQTKRTETCLNSIPNQIVQQVNVIDAAMTTRISRPYS